MTTGSNAVVSGTNTSGLYGSTGSVTVQTGAYGNANVAAFLASYTGNLTAGNASVSGNITGGNILSNNYLYANGQPISFAGTYSNANVAAFLPVYSGNISAGNGTITNDLTVGGTIYGTFSGNVSGNLVVPGANTEILFNNAGNAGASSDFRFNSATRVMLLNGTANVANIIVPQTGTINLGNSRIQNVAEPVSGSDAATKDYVDGGFSSDIFSITADGNTFGVAKLDNIIFQGVANQTTVTIPANDTLQIGLANTVSVSGNITGGNIVTVGTANVANIIVPQVGTINVGNSRIQNVADPIANTDAVTKQYVDSTSSGDLLSITTSSDGFTSGISKGDDITFQAVANQTVITSAVADTVEIGLANSIVISGNMTASYFIGNGSQLTGLAATYSNANVANYLPTYSGNVGSISTPITLTGNDANIIGSTVRMTGNSVTVSAGVTTLDLQAQQTIRLRSPLGTTANVLIESLNTSVTGNIIHTNGLLSTTGNVTAANVLTGGAVSATGNVTGNYIIGDGSLLTNLPGGSYGNANVANYLPTFTGNVGAGNLVITSTSGVAYVNNITGLAGAAITIAPDGTNDVHLDANTVRIGDNNTDATLTTHGTGDLILTTHQGSAAEGNIILRDGASGNIDIQTNGSGVVNITGTAGLRVADGISAVGNITGGNLVTTGQISATGNITGNYFLGNGSQLTGISGTYSNANVSAFLAAFGSNTISTSGNITSGNIIANGQFLTNLPGANVTGTVANATYALSANSATFAGTVTTAAQPNITSVGTLTSVSVTGNVQAGNLRTTGVVSATGNITGNYYFGNGSQLTGIVASAAGSNTQVIFNDNGVLAGDTNLTFNKNTGVLTTDDISSQTVSTSTLTATSGLINANLDVRGNVFNGSGTAVKIDDDLIVYGTLATTGNVNPTTGISCTGNVSGNYFIGDGSQLTNISGGNIVGGYGNANVATFLAAYGSNTFSSTGNVTTTGVFTASNTSANLQVANIVFNNQQLQTVGARNPAVISATVADPGRIVIGTGFGGNLSPGVDLNSTGRGSRLLIADSISQADNQQRTNGLAVQQYVTATANITNTNTRVFGASTQLLVGGGSSANTWGAATVTAVTGQGGAVLIGGGTTGNLTSMGNTTVRTCVGTSGFVITNAGGIANSATAMLAGLVATGNIANAVGYGINFVSTSGTPYTGNVYGVYLPGSSSPFDYNISNAARAATNYYFLRNDDNVAQTKMGAMRLWHNYRYDHTTTTGAITIDKNNGQTQYIAVTGNITGITLSNFVTTASDGTTTDQEMDTVTLWLRQDATGRTITMPTGANYFYESGTTTVSTTANSVSKIEFTAIDNAGTTQYLIDISAAYTST